MKYSETKASQLTGLSRATIQRYRDSVGKENRKVIDPMYEQKDGLKYCYFNEIEMEKLWMIKIFQSLGKTREEIVGIMTDTKINMLKHLSIAIEELDKLLTIAKQYVNTGISHRVIKEVLYENKDVSYEQLDDILKLISSEMCEEEKILERKIINNDRIERLFNTIIECYDNHIPFTDSKIQNSIRHIMRELCPCKYYSLEMLSGFLIAILGQIHIDDNNAKICRYLYDAIEYYKNNTKELNQEYCVDNVFNNVANYYVNGHKSDSKIVFDEILGFIYATSPAETYTSLFAAGPASFASKSTSSTGTTTLSCFTGEDSFLLSDLEVSSVSTGVASSVFVKVSSSWFREDEVSSV